MGYKFLLVDDDYDDRTFFCEAVAEIESDVTCFTLDDSRKLLSETNADMIREADIIFLDVNMPKMSGWDCLSFLKEKKDYKHIPVIMYSTSSHAEDIKKSYLMGAICFFTKPHYFVDLKKAIKDTIEHLQNNTLAWLAKESALFLVPED